MNNDCFICEQKTKQKAGTNVLCTVLDEDISPLIVTSLYHFYFYIMTYDISYITPIYIWEIWSHTRP
jgi:hypothetical protein